MQSINEILEYIETTLGGQNGLEKAAADWGYPIAMDESDGLKIQHYANDVQELLYSYYTLKINILGLYEGLKALTGKGSKWVNKSHLNKKVLEQIRLRMSQAANESYPQYAINRKGENFLRIKYIPNPSNLNSWQILDKKGNDVTKCVLGAL